MVCSQGRHYALLLLLFSISYAAPYKPWFTATRAPNNNGTLYVVGGGIPSYMEALVPKPLFIIKNSSGGLDAVPGASGAKSLSFPLDGDCLLVATDTCVLAVSEGGLKVRAIAGSCTEYGRRNGPLMFARFMSLVAISAVVDEGRLFIALLDSGNLLLADSWSVNDVSRVEGGAFDLSMPRAKEGGFKEIAILVLTPLSAILILGKNGDGGERVMFVSALRWKLYTVFSLKSSSSYQISSAQSQISSGNSSQISSGDGYNSSNGAALMVETFTACLLQTTADGYTAYLTDTDGTLWRMIVVIGDDESFEKTTDIYRKKWNDGLTSFYFSKLLWVACDPAATSMCLGVLDTLNSRFIDIHNDNEVFWTASSDNNNNTNASEQGCIFPWQIGIICENGHMWLPRQNICAPSPPGGYVDRSTLGWVACPVGTYNPLPMAMSSAACKRCAAGSIAPFSGSVICSFCNDTHPLQSTSGSECLSTCGSSGSVFCKSCLPGSEPDRQNDACQLCPDNFYSATSDQPCLPCPPNFTSVVGASYCSAQCPPGTCSPDGISSCFPWPTSSAHAVYTVADFRNSADYLLSIAVCHNGTIFLGNDRGYLIIYHGEGGAGDGLVLSVDMAYLGVKSLNAMALSSDASRLFVADTLEGLIVVVSGAGSQMEMLASKTSNIMPRSLCSGYGSNDEGGGLYVVDARNDSLIWLAPNNAQQLVFFWPGLVFVTPHEDGHGVVCLVKNKKDSEEVLYSIWHISQRQQGSGNNYESTLLSQVFRSHTFKSTPTIQPWISRWKKGKTAICIDNAVALISDGNNNNNSGSFMIAAGGGGEPNNNNIIAPIAASLKHSGIDFSNNHSDNDELLFLLEDQTFSIQVVFARSCECAPNFYKTPSQACVPCPPHTYSMPGARGCSACPSGEYMNLRGECTMCPLTLWWDSEISSIMYGPCRRLQGTLSSTMRGVMLTLLEAQDLADTGNKNNYILVKDLDIISNATILLTGIDDDLIVPPPDIWIRGDLLGRLWSLQSRLTPTQPFDPQGVAVLNHPGIWALCSQIVLPGAPCTCRHAALQLGHGNNWWQDARNEATMENLPHFSFTSVFVLRPDDNHMTAPILIQYGGGSISLVPRFPIGDMGVCLMGWPAQFNCTDPNYFWEFPSESYPGGACLPCPPDTIAPTHSSVKCKPVTYQNPLCKPGSFKTFLANFSSYVCRLCQGNTYSSTQGAIKCLQKKILSCPQGFYVKDGGYTSDNMCIPCVPCGESSIMIPFLVNPCPGNTQRQPYVCVAWLQSVPGFSVALAPSLRYIPCAGLPPFAVWASGPQRDICFFRCKFGVNEPAVKEYAFYWALLSPENEIGGVHANLFPFAAWSQQQTFTASAIKAMSAVCAPCNTSVCPQGMWRPLWSDGCGPPCHISPSLCQGRTDGCVSICNVPENASIQSYDTVDQEGRSVCLWRCNIGFVRTGETCAACNASLCQPGESYIGNSQCSPEMSLAQICPPCPPTVMGGVLNLEASERGRCSYTCLKGYYYQNPNPNSFLQIQMACIQCAGAVTRCPAGYSVTCAANPCKVCQTPDTLLSSGKAVMVPTSDSICRVQCLPGFHTVNLLDRTVLLDKEITAFDPSKISCEECSRRPFIPCPVLSCGPGYQIGASNDACVPCKNSPEMGCPEGTYAPPCPGGRVTQTIGCLNCPMYALLVAAAIESGDSVPDKWPTRMFVPSSSLNYVGGGQSTIINSNVSKTQSIADCLTACVNGAVQVKSSNAILACVACSVFLPTPPKNAPYQEYFSTWNATNGLRWWPPEFDPPHLQRRPLDSRGNLRSEGRAGLCWPCPPPYTALFVLLSSGDPCFDRWATTNNNNNYNPLPSADTEVVIDGDNSKQPDFVWILDGKPVGGGRRRLLSLSYTAHESPSDIQAFLAPKQNVYSSALGVVCGKGQYPAPPLASWCAMCPEGHYCAGGNSQPVQCGPFSSAAMGSTSPENCSCIPGFVSLFSSCVLGVPSLDFPCPSGFYKETNTFSAKGPQTLCFPCAAGTREKNGRCHDCPLQSTSKEASKTCSCAPDNNLTKNGDENAGSGMISTTGACPSGDCPQGSSLDFTDSKCKSCSHKMALPIPNVFPLTCSCGPGSYYHHSPSAPVIQCLPCPRGKFSQFAGEAPCTQCPEGTITLLERSTTLTACVKSNILDADVVVGGNHSHNATFIKV
jgi:hypothetical protein